jgi:hypothetical protein
MHEYAGAWKASAALTARMSAQRLQDQLAHERDPEVQQKVSRRIVALTKIAQALDVPAAPSSGLRVLCDG